AYEEYGTSSSKNNPKIARGSKGGYKSDEYQEQGDSYDNDIPGKPGVDYPIFHAVPETRFACDAMPTRPGMYADVDTGCQVYRICDDGRHGKSGAGFLCTNGTIFNQAVFTCDWWYNVDCSQAPQLYKKGLFKSNFKELATNSSKGKEQGRKEESQKILIVFLKLWTVEPFDAPKSALKNNPEVEKRLLWAEKEMFVRYLGNRTNSTESKVCQCFETDSNQLQASRDLLCLDPRANIPDDSSAFRQKILSFTLFGEKKRYIQGAALNVARVPRVYPGWNMRIYHNIPEGTRLCESICKLRSENGILQTCPIDERVLGPHLMRAPKTLWRFFPIADSRVSVFASRDTDAFISEREAAAVSDWLSTNKTLHTMNDHRGHVWPILAGMWGAKLSNPRARADLLQLMREMLDYGSLGINYFKEADQTLLMATVFNHFKGSKDWLNHASHHCHKFGVRSKPFPTRRESQLQDGVLFVGGPQFATNQSNLLIECKPACRPQDHLDWKYC
ncbi:unnamed protein product, partial [Notodromas monacha]